MDSLEPRIVKPGGQVNKARPPTSRLTIDTRRIRSEVTLVMSEQRTLSQKGIGEFHVPDGRQVSSGAPIKALLFWQEKNTLVPILVLRFEAMSPLRSGICGQCTGWTIISTLWWCRVGVVHVNIPESSFCAWKMLSRYSSVLSRPSSSVQPSGYFLYFAIDNNIRRLITT
jgi:hypothetical protein